MLFGRRGGFRGDSSVAAARGASAVPPKFPAGAKVVVKSPFDGKDRKGRASKQIEVSFPAATAGDGRPRAYDYEVAAEVEESGARRIAKSKRVYSPTYFLAPERDGGTVRCVFSVNELGTRKAKWFSPKVRFVVRAAESFGKTSAPLVSESTRLQASAIFRRRGLAPIASWCIIGAWKKCSSAFA